MASNKNQHFVPRCYLRPFALNDGKTISLYNIDRDRSFFNSPLKNQCSRDYFYGKDEGLERLIQLVESNYASELPALLRPGNKISSTSYIILSRFWFLQQVRTEAASRRTVEMAVEADELIGHPQESFALDIKQAVQVAMKAFSDYMTALDDLEIVLVENKTTMPFITSDDPAVMVNRWVDMKVGRSLGPGYGINAAGLICLLPLSPTIYCILYDKDIYSIASKNNWLTIKAETDVETLNAMQYQNCFANLYFKDQRDSNLFEALRINTHQLRPTERHRIHYAIKVETKPNYVKFISVDKSNIPQHTEALIHSEAIRIKPSKWPSFIRWRPNGSYYSNDSGAGHIRKAHAISDPHTPYTKRRSGQ